MTQKRILQEIKKHQYFLLSTHANPDPDALCSELSLAIFLRNLGKKVTIVNADPVPDKYRFLPRTSWIVHYHESLKVNCDAIIVVDCGDLERIDKVQKLLPSGKPIINIDHHVTNQGFGDANLIVAQASSTAEVLFDFFKFARFKITKDIAQLLYVGIMTDTGSFRYDGTSAHTHAVIAELMKYEIPVSEIYRRIYEQMQIEDIKHFGQVINCFDVRGGGKVVFVELTEKRLKQFSRDFDIKDKVFGFARAIVGVKVIAIFSQLERQLTRVNFRSQDQFDVARLASCFGGGGHKKASGCLLKKNLKETQVTVWKEIERML